jgi:hypothetical protein
MRDFETIDSELRQVVALRRAARECGGPLPSVDVADALLDERLRVDLVMPAQIVGMRTGRDSGTLDEA